MLHDYGTFILNEYHCCEYNMRLLLHWVPQLIHNALILETSPPRMSREEEASEETLDAAYAVFTSPSLSSTDHVRGCQPLALRIHLMPTDDHRPVSNCTCQLNGLCNRRMCTAVPRTCRRRLEVGALISAIVWFEPRRITRLPLRILWWPNSSR